MNPIARRRQSNSGMPTLANPNSLTSTTMNITKHLLRESFATFFAIILPLTCVWAQTNPPADVTISGIGTDVDFGWQVAPAGDVNGDGVTDFIVGDPSNSSVAQFAGRAYLFLGPLTSDIDTSKAVATISAEAFGDNLGFSVASAGDVNGDGFDDILIGARSNDDNGIQSGRVYLFYGPVSGSLDATTADAIIEGAAFDEIGRAVAPLGDVNGDGFDDIVVGSDIAGGGSRGEIFIFNGPLSGTRTVASADATIIGSFADESFGASIASAGDINGDGVNDIIVGAPRFPLNGADTGRAYVFFGPVTGSLIATQANAIIFGEAVNDDFGVAVAGGKDINGDGVPDVIVGADQLFATAGAGKAYVFYGPLGGNIQAANADAILTGEVDRDLFGMSVTSVGDFNGDGISDVTVGAPDNGAGGVRSGRVYTFFGPLSGTIAAANADSIVTGSNQDELGMSVGRRRRQWRRRNRPGRRRAAIRNRHTRLRRHLLRHGKRAVRNQAYPYSKGRPDCHPSKRRQLSFSAEPYQPQFGDAHNRYPGETNRARDAAYARAVFRDSRRG